MAPMFQRSRDYLEILQATQQSRRTRDARTDDLFITCVLILLLLPEIILSFQLYIHTTALTTSLIFISVVLMTDLSSTLKQYLG